MDLYCRCHGIYYMVYIIYLPRVCKICMQNNGNKYYVVKRTNYASEESNEDIYFFPRGQGNESCNPIGSWFYARARISCRCPQAALTLSSV